MLQLVNLYKKSCNECKEDPKIALQKMDKKINKTLYQLNKLFSSSLRSDIKISHTLFGKYNLDQPSKTFFAQVLTSHLQTGCTVVVGSNEKLIAEWVDTLSYFLLPHQRNIARSTVEIGKENFLPDLALQGLICSQEEITKKLRKCTSSTTVLILKDENSPVPINGDQNPQNPQNPHNTHNFNNNQVKQYYPSIDIISSPRPELRNSDELMLRNVEISYEVNEMIERIFKVEGNFLKRGYISQMMSLLMRKATVLLKYVEAMPVNMDPMELPYESTVTLHSNAVFHEVLADQGIPGLDLGAQDPLMSRETKKKEFEMI